MTLPSGSAIFISYAQGRTARDLFSSFKHDAAYRDLEEVDGRPRTIARNAFPDYYMAVV